jgi:hypothetical protein
MRSKRTILLVLAFLGAIAVPGTARAQGDISISIEKHARLTADGGVILGVRVACGPFPGIEEFREASAGASQARTGAEAEGALSPDVVCDGVERAYAALVFPITDAVFARGPADAGVSVTACNVVGDDQVCAHAAIASRIVIVGRSVP